MGLKERQAELLSRLERDSLRGAGAITAKAIASWAGCTERTAHRWISGDTLIQLEELNELLRCDEAPPELREGLLQIVLTGTRRVSVIAEVGTGGTVGGGAPHAANPRGVGIAGVLRSFADMAETHESAMADGRVDDAELERIQIHAEEAHRGIAKFVDGLAASRELRSGPRMARPFANGLTPSDADRSRRPVGAAG